MKYIVILLLSFFALNCTGCRGSHSIECVSVSQQTVCFVREVWGLNGDVVSLTISDNVCHKPSKETDFVSDALGAGEGVYYKIYENTLFVYGSTGEMLKPEKSFPIKVVFEDFHPLNPDDEFLIREGYTQLNLGQSTMTWCFSDIF